MSPIFTDFKLKWISENRFGRYLVYAIGEIILIILGILIALALNSWKNDQNNRAKEIEYLRQLKEEMKANLPLVNNAIYTAERHTDAGVQLLRFCLHNAHVDLDTLNRHLVILMGEEMCVINPVFL